MDESNTAAQRTFKAQVSDFVLTSAELDLVQQFRQIANSLTKTIGVVVVLHPKGSNNKYAEIIQLY